jgi:HlyD family secretion protein
MVKINKMFIVIVVCIIVLAALYSFNYLSEETVKVKTAEAALGEITQSISYAGSINSPRRVKVGSKIAGRVAAVLFDELDEVRADQVLIKLEDAELKAQLSQAQEALNQAQINLVTIEKNLTRVKELFKKGFASTEQLETAQQAYDVGEALIKQNQANHAFIRARLGSTIIAAPISGTIVSKNVTVGEIVAGPLGGGSFSVPTPMAEVADLSNLEVHADVDEVDISKVHVEQEALITVDAYPDKTFKGVVREIAAATVSRRDVGITYRVKVHIINPEKILKLGMTANLDFLLENSGQILTVPKSAILVQGDEQIVLIIKDQQVFKRTVEIGMEGEEFIEITAGLQPGEEVVTSIITDSTEAAGGLPFGNQGIIPDDILSKLEDGQSVIIVP